MHGTYDVAGATLEENTLWGGKCMLGVSSMPAMRYLERKWQAEHAAAD